MIGDRHPLLVAAFAGALFGAGLLVSGMTIPAHVVGFLDPFHSWDPTLMFVMFGGVAFYAVAYRAIRARRTEPFFDVQFHLPTRSDIDRRLLIGAALFGVGWGLGGMCPGPGVVAAAAGNGSALWFVGAMIGGMVLKRLTAD